MICLTVSRLITTGLFNKSSDKQQQKYYFLFFLQMLITTSLWGFSGFIIFSQYNTSNILVIVCVMGLSIGGISSLSSDYKILLAFLTLLLIPFTFRMFLYQDEFYNTIGVLLIIFQLLMIIASKRIHQLINDNILFSYKNKKTMDDLTVSENKFRNIFEHAPIGIFYYNKDLVVYDCNEVFCQIFESPREKLINLDMKQLKDTRVFHALREPFYDKTGYYEGEYLTTLSNNKIWVTLNCSPLYNDEQKVSPDAGSAKRAASWARSLNLPLAIMDKRRSDDNDDARIYHVIGEVKGKDALIFDDEISTAGSMIEAEKALRNLKVNSIRAFAVHGVLAGPAVERLKSSSFDEVVITNTVATGESQKWDKLTILDVAPLFADAISRINSGDSLSSLFRN